jgi:sulfofructose kinase
MTARVICVGHAALDRVYRISDFPAQPTKVRALEHVESGGGMAANAAVAIARLGGKVELWSRVGEDDAGRKIREGLKAAKVDVRNVQLFDNARSSTSAIIVDGRGERLIVGNRDTGMPSETSWLPLERIGEADVILVDVRWLEASRAVLSRARIEGVPTVLDADLGAREALPELLELADYAIFAEPALMDFTHDLPLDAPIADRLARVIAKGVRHAGVTRGARGYAWIDRDPRTGTGSGLSEAEGFTVDVVDTTGAGDAFHGAIALFIAEGMAIGEAVEAANAAAALKCTRLGSRAGLPTRTELDLFLTTGRS